MVRGRRQASSTTRWGGRSFLGRILLWTQNRQQLPTVWKQTVKQSRLLRLQHPIKCNLNQASHLVSIPFSLCFPSVFGQSLQLCSLTLIVPDTFQTSPFAHCPRENEHSLVRVRHPNSYLQTLLPPTAAGSVHFRGLAPLPAHPMPPAVAQITLQGYSEQNE